MTPVLRCKCKCAICLFKCPAGPTTGSHLHLFSLWSGQTIHFPPPDVPICSSRGFSSYFYGYRQDKCPDCLLTVLWPELVFSHLQRHLGYFSFFAEKYLNVLSLAFKRFVAAAAVPQDARSERRARLSVECDLLQAQPCQLWGTEVWP